MSMPIGKIVVPEELKRDLELRVRISETERDALFNFCQSNNMSVSDFVRSRLFEVVNVQQPPTRGKMPLVW